MDVLEAIYQRRSVRAYTDQPVDRTTVEALIKAATHAPSSMNEQPWAFIVIQDSKRLASWSERIKAYVLKPHHHATAIVGAGWDPGALSVFRSWFALLTPGGSTETRHHTGISLRHTTMARSVTGVKDALCAEVRAADGKFQRYVYVELEKGADADTITQSIRVDPLFLGEDTQVFPVESLAALEQEGRGVVLDRRGLPGRFGHQHLLLEARFDETVLTAQVMLAAARALPGLEPGAYFLADVPLGRLWGERVEMAHRDWL